LSSGCVLPSASDASGCRQSSAQRRESTQPASSPSGPSMSRESWIGTTALSTLSSTSSARSTPQQPESTSPSTIESSSRCRSSEVKKELALAGANSCLRADEKSAYPPERSRFSISICSARRSSRESGAERQSSTSSQSRESVDSTRTPAATSRLMKAVRR
jgi:hypothetical protein